MTRALLLLGVCCGLLGAQTSPLTFTIAGPNNTVTGQTLSSNYSFAATPQGQATSISIIATNVSQSRVELVQPNVTVAADPTSIASPNYSVSGENPTWILSPGGVKLFTLNFIPTTTGQLTGYLQVVYVTDGNGCTIGSANNPSQCTVPLLVSSLQGTGAPAQWQLSENGTNVYPNAGAARLDFGSTELGTSSSITFTLANQTGSPLAAPVISLETSAEASGSTLAFALNTANLPATLAANSSGTFTVTFAPGQTGLTVATLLVGSNAYDIEGTGAANSSADSLVISYVDSNKNRVSPQAAVPISFGSIAPGGGSSLVLTFTVANTDPNTFGPVTLPVLTVTGSAFTLGGAPSLPAVIQPNGSITFTVTFTATASNTYSGTLTIGNLVFSLAGQVTVSSVPAITIQASEQPLTSAQQVNLSIQAATAATQEALGTLTMKFTPAVSGVTDDPAIVFLATSGRQLQVDLAQGAQTATYNKQAAIGFQTGTTAGTITFTLTFPNAAPITQSYTITPEQIYLTSSQALRQSPNLVITLDGYDNTYTAGQLSFVFYDTNGNQMNANAMAVDATSNFHQYFFTNNAAGGSFSMQASFPVTGDATKIGAVGITMTNSAGQATTKLSFQ